MTDLTAAEVSMDVGPTVEKPAGGDTKMLRDEDDDITEGWSLINLDAPQSADTELVINERARQLLLELASSYVPFTGLHYLHFSGFRLLCSPRS